MANGVIGKQWIINQYWLSSFVISTYISESALGCYILVLPSLLNRFRMRTSIVLWLLGLGYCLAQKEPFTFDDFLTGRYGARGYSASWVSDNELEYRDSAGNVVNQNVETNETTIVVPAAILTEYAADSYSISPDKNYVLISYDTQQQFRHSVKAKYVAVNLRDISLVTPIENSNLIPLARWGPVGNALLWVNGRNNIMYMPAVTAFPELVTLSGVNGVIFNGIPDWVYEEEVLGTGIAHWFSPDGKKLVYIEFADYSVPDLTYQRYGSPGTLESQYPEEVTIKYPKAGQVNPEYEVYLFVLSGNVAHKQRVPKKITPTPKIPDKPSDSVIYGATWLNNNEFSLLTMNRVQNESWLDIVSADNFSIQQTIYNGNPNGWAQTTSYEFDSTGKYSLSIESQSVGSAGNFSHLVLRDLANDQETRLTNGTFIVTSIIGWDEKTNNIYYTANSEDSHSSNNVYVVSSSGGQPTCLSCSIVSPEGNACLSASASFSKAFSYVILTCSGPDPAVIALYKNEVPLKAPLVVYQDNAQLRESLKTKAVPQQKDLTLDVDAKFSAKVRLFLPQDYDESKKYPLLIEVYAGPDSNQIGDGFATGWKAYLTSNLNIIYGLIDGRGSGRRGDDLLFANYRALGTLEIYDQINITRQLQQKFSFIDAERSAIWGWSYGGYATGRSLELDTEGVFKCGISVAPVTSWLYYDSVYTERYMGLPTEEDNLAAYKDGDLVSHVDNLKKKKYYLIHGNADDNVHYQQSMLLSRALELDDVLFRQQSYPDENHSLGGVSRHVYHSMDAFWKECFDIQE